MGQTSAWSNLVQRLKFQTMIYGSLLCEKTLVWCSCQLKERVSKSRLLCFKTHCKSRSTICCFVQSFLNVFIKFLPQLDVFLVLLCLNIWHFQNKFVTLRNCSSFGNTFHQFLIIFSSKNNVKIEFFAMDLAKSSWVFGWKSAWFFSWLEFFWPWVFRRPWKRKAWTRSSSETLQL